jgi:hypothetical protein
VQSPRDTAAVVEISSAAIRSARQKLLPRLPPYGTVTGHTPIPKMFMTAASRTKKPARPADGSDGVPAAAKA